MSDSQYTAMRENVRGGSFPIRNRLQDDVNIAKVVGLQILGQK